MKKTYQLINKKNNQLFCTIICYDKNVEKGLLKQFKKISKYINFKEVPDE